MRPSDDDFTLSHFSHRALAANEESADDGWTTLSYQSPTWDAWNT